MNFEPVPVDEARALYDKLKNWREVATLLKKTTGENWKVGTVQDAVRRADRGGYKLEAGRWSEKWIGRLKYWQSEKLSATDIAFELSREMGQQITRGMVVSKLHQQGLSPMSRDPIGGHGRVKHTAGPPKAPKQKLPRSNFNPTFKKPGAVRPPQTPYPPRPTEDQKEYILGQGVPLTDSIMEIVGEGKQASIRWSGGLQPGQCKWVINTQERGGEYLFCGARVLSGCIYCGQHERRAYGRWTAEAA